MTKRKNAKTATAAVETVAPELTTVPAPDMNLESLLGDLAALEEEQVKLEEAELREQIVAQAQAADEADEAAEAPATDEEPTEVLDPIDEVEHVPGVLKEMLEAVTEEQKVHKQAEVNDAFARRASFERSRGSKKLGKLDSYRQKMSTLPLCAVLVATDVDPDFINRSISEGKRFNIYAIDKLNDVLMGLETGTLKNAHNRAIMKSLFAFRKAGMSFTGLMAQAAASDKIKVEPDQAKLLTRHTVDAGTAPTQASSTMSALQIMGIVINRGSQKYPEWTLTDTPQTRALEEVLAAA